MVAGRLVPRSVWLPCTRPQEHRCLHSGCQRASWTCLCHQEVQAMSRATPLIWTLCWRQKSRPSMTLHPCLQWSATWLQLACPSHWLRPVVVGHGCPRSRLGLLLQLPLVMTCSALGQGHRQQPAPSWLHALHVWTLMRAPAQPHSWEAWRCCLRMRRCSLGAVRVLWVLFYRMCDILYSRVRGTALVHKPCQTESCAGQWARQWAACRSLVSSKLATPRRFM
mmetsp:Transcript_13681/g.33681  ORF Transcript_13681/g.33681 Transcript_13681/m.33681 type:complete len:223 (-) Transcript_13681:30-698(-)